MKLQKQKPRQTLNPAFRRQRPGRSEINLFKANLLTLLEKIDESESEEHVKNQVRDFLRDTYYKETNEVNTKGRQDLAIYTGKTNESKVGVIIEAKRPKNHNEWFKSDNANCKAFQELVLYYMRERENLKNIDVKYLIATNIYEWYIIEASYFENLFFKDKDFLKEFVEFDKKQKVTTNTDLFYNNIAKPFIDNIDKTIPCAYFNIKDFDKAIRNNDKKEDANLIALIKILSPFHLLKLEFADDSNSLKESFYKELLHIIGLEERKEGSKYIIDRKKEGQRNAGSLIENAINMLETEDPLHKIPDLSAYGNKREERVYNIALELCITWINRILFLKLLEGQLQNYHQKNPEYLFLNSEMIPNYDELHKLFHQVLAKTLKERTPAINEKYKRVPYLNSSLFDISKLEDQTIKINSLDNDYDLELASSTVLKEIKKKSLKLPALNYLFRFLSAFDFSSEGGEEIQEDENRTLINASVLGKVFEKINGYKDGSIFTPGFITMYMCRQAIRNTVVQKFKDKYKKWRIEHFTDLRNYLKDRRTTKEILEDNALINSIHLCDPAVGSGHFLVSSLNEIIAIKSELGLLADKNGDRLSDYQIVIAQDELIVTDQNGNDFKYEISNGKPLTKEMQRLQKTLFEEKQTIIENCLFGVDINPNSVKICGLRLWVELLKNAYYKEDTNFQELETLPNIDINIKCNNSLISRFSLDADLSKALESTPYDIEAYRDFVNDLKNEKNKDAKRNLEKIIDDIKGDLRIEISKNDPKQIRLRKINGDLFNMRNQTKMFELESKAKKAFVEKKEKLEKEINKLSKEVKEIETNASYKNAFEWRFEFPEVLNNKGEFEGFDLIIGNPPYIKARDYKNQTVRKVIENSFKSTVKMWDIYIPFIEQGLKILKPEGRLTYIIPDTIGLADYTKKIVEIIEKKHQLSQIDFYPNHFIFDGVGVKNKIIFLNKKNDGTPTRRILHEPLPTDEIILNSNYTEKKYLPETSDFVFPTNKTLQLSEICFVSYGLRLNSDKDDVKYKFKKEDLVSETKTVINTRLYTEGKYLDRYFVKKKLYVEWDTERCPSKLVRPTFPELYNPEKLLLARQKRIAAYSNEKLICDNTIIMAILAKDLKTIQNNNIKKYYANLSIERKVIEKNSERFSLKYILAIINSSLIAHFIKFNNQGSIDFYPDDWKKIPIKDVSLNEQNQFITIVDFILFSKSITNELLSSFFERLIDAMIYELYLPIIMQKGNCEVLKHIINIPELIEGEEDKNLKKIEKVYKELSHPTHPVSSSLLRMRNIEEIEVIENKK